MEKKYEVSEEQLEVLEALTRCQNEEMSPLREVTIFKQPLIVFSRNYYPYFEKGNSELP